MDSITKYDSFHIIKKISGEISLDFTNQTISQKFNKIIKSKKFKRKNNKKNDTKEKNSIIKNKEPKLENLTNNKTRKEFIPLPLIDSKSENIKEETLSNKSYSISNDSFSYIMENSKKNNIENIFQKMDKLKNINYNILRNKLNNYIIYFFKNNFECKLHSNNKYTTYCSVCKKNICQQCLVNDLSHIEHKIYYLKDIMPSEIHIKYYKTLFIFSKYYLDKIREIIIEIYNDLTEFYEKEKDTIKKILIQNIQKQLKKGYKKFYIKNYYQLMYAKKIISIFCYCKDLQCINYQIINNLYDIKINSVKIPDLFDQHILIKAKTMIEFMNCNSHNILKSSDSSHPSTIYRYRNNEKKSGNIVNSINIEKYKSFSDLFIKNPGVIYEPTFKHNSKSDKLGNNEDKEKNLRETLYQINKKIKNKILSNYNKIKANININLENKTFIEKSDKSDETNSKRNSKDNNINPNTKKDSKTKINIKNSSKGKINNLDLEVKDYILSTLPNSIPDEVEYKMNIQYSYFDKPSQKEINCIYHGEFRKNTLIRHGRGLFIWEDGEFYLGYWANDKREGKGTNTYSNGDVYQGEYKNGKKEGNGTYKWANGDVYIGCWKNDMKDGEGKYKYNNGDRYIGLFKMDKIDGNGIYIWANQNTYKGQFKNNEIEGKGILNYICSNANKEIKDIHSKIIFQKNRGGKEDKKCKSNDDKKYIEIFTCERTNENKSYSEIKNNDINF